MKPILKYVILVFLISFLAMDSSWASDPDPDIAFHPVHHASLVIQSASWTIYVDPVGDLQQYAGYPKADLILITHTHKDHLNKEVIDGVKQPGTLIITNSDAAAQLMEGKILKNGESLDYKGITIEAVPAYNMTGDRLDFHPRGRDNGYVITLSEKRIYLSGDTEDTTEMRQLKNIDYAFICMNLPYTMTEDQAASAVLEFKPRVVFPYHYKGKNGFSDINRFKTMVEKDPAIQVRLLPWY
ncbi:MAG: MBL fold metallo-hydrolase [Pseudomonadota bacterium]